MKLTVALNRAELKQAAGEGQKVDLGEIIGDSQHTKVLRVFGNGRYANVETDAAGLKELKTRLGNICIFSTSIPAEGF